MKSVEESNTYYESVDGIKFDSQEICKDYEEAMTKVYLQRLKEAAICVSNGIVEDEDCAEYYMLVADEHIISMVNFIRVSFSPKTPLFTTKDVGKIICLGVRRYNEVNIDYVWTYVLDDIVKTLTADRYIITKNPNPEN